jgi:protein-tyrosine phosphatase
VTAPATTAPTDPAARRDDAVPTWKEAAAWALGLSLVFLVGYGGSNLIATRLDGGPGFHFEWERRLPVVPAMIVPYWSVDVLFFASFFLCTRRDELRTHGLRFVVANLVSATFFLLFPLRFAFDRPVVGGVFGWMFDTLHFADAPFNLAPSLHVADLCILWPLYVRHTRGALRLLAKAWIVLIAVSTLLTYQHHVIDVVTGFMLGMVCLYALPDRETLNESAGYRPTGPALREGSRLGRRYAAGAAALALCAIVLRGWWWFLLWPAASLAVVAAGYVRFGPAIFRKSCGRLPFSTRCVLGPYLLAAWASWLYFRRRVQPWVQVAPGVVIGRRLTNREARALVREDVTAVLDLTAEYDEARALRGLPYLNVPVLDLTTPSREQLDHAVAFIRQHAADGKVFVHCALGLSRAACVAAAYLVSEQIAATAEAAVGSIRNARPAIVCGENSLGAVREYCGSAGALSPSLAASQSGAPIAKPQAAV